MLKHYDADRSAYYHVELFLVIKVFSSKQRRKYPHIISLKKKNERTNYFMATKLNPHESSISITKLCICTYPPTIVIF